jgi:hypothetical protein
MGVVKLLLDPGYCVAVFDVHPDVMGAHNQIVGTERLGQDHAVGMNQAASQVEAHQAD